MTKYIICTGDATGQMYLDPKCAVRALVRSGRYMDRNPRNYRPGAVSRVLDCDYLIVEWNHGHVDLSSPSWARYKCDIAVVETSDTPAVADISRLEPSEWESWPGSGYRFPGLVDNDFTF